MERHLNIRSLVGTPYNFPSHPPHTFDCWSLVKYVRGLKGLECPLPFSDAEEWCMPVNMVPAIAMARESWTTMDEPVDFCMAVMERSHVGVVLDDGVLHALARNSTVVWTPMRAIHTRWPKTEWWNA